MDLISTSSGSGQWSVETSSLIHADSSQCYSPSNKESWKSLVFKSIKEIEDFYGNYAYNIGFSIRTMLKSKNNSQNKKSDKVHYVRYVCNKQGFKATGQHQIVQWLLSLWKWKKNLRKGLVVKLEYVWSWMKFWMSIRYIAGICLKLYEVLNVYKIYNGNETPEDFCSYCKEKKEDFGSSFLLFYFAIFFY